MAKISALPPEEQEYYAVIFLNEIEDEQRWTDSFEASQDVLGALADEALAEYEQGNTTDMDLSAGKE